MTAHRHTAVLTVPAAIVLNSNQRRHWSKNAPATRALRMLGRNLGARALDPVAGLVRIDIDIWKPSARRYDPSNLYPTAKAIIDGLRDARILAEDDYHHLDGPHLHHGGTDPDLRLDIRLHIHITPKD